MPEMGGDQLARMLTGFGDLMDAKREQPAGVDAVVSKPVTLDNLASAIRQVLARS